MAFENCTNHSDYSEYKTFNEAFKKAREDNEKVFKWKGKKYTTELVDKETSDLYLESKRFLEEYYSSDYFKSKQPIDSFSIKMDLYNEVFNNLRYIYLYNKENLTPAEADELYEFFLEEEKLAKYDSPTFKFKVDSIQTDQAKKRIENLEKPVYLSITNQKGGIEEEGNYKIDQEKGRHSMFIYRKKGSADITTPIHELSHQATQSNDLIEVNACFDMLERAYLSAKDNQDFIMKYGQEGFDYLSNPTEIDARQNSTRFWLFKNFKGYKANSVFEAEHFNFLKENYERLSFDIQQLLDLFPDQDIFVENMNKF